MGTATEPRRIFLALPTRAPKYARPWDVQTQVWDRWHGRRTESDLLVKMNTGGGKTVVGLMMLKSCLNEGAGPAVYITPDIYLAEQIRAEADALGIETTDDPRSGRSPPSTTAPRSTTASAPCGTGTSAWWF